MDAAIRDLAGFAASVRYADLPVSVVRQAHRVLLDTVGATLFGSQAPEVRTLAQSMASESGPSRILGTGIRTTALNAMFVNSMAACWNEMDEGHRFAGGHPGIHIVPVVLALGEALDASLATVVEALVAGYEVAARVGVAASLRPDLHPHGMWGALGAATAAGRLYGLTADEIAAAIEHASAIMIAPPMSAALDGSTIRNAYAPIACQHGAQAARLAQVGITPVEGATATVLGRVLGKGWDAAALTEGLGTRFEIERNYFKPYSACRHTHGAIELASTLQQEHRFAVEDIADIEITTYNGACSLNRPLADTPLAARFSIPMLVALTLHGDDLRTLTAEQLHVPAVRTLASKVHLTLDPAMDASYPETRPTHVAVRLTSGDVRTLQHAASLGDPERPLGDFDLDAKFIALSANVLGDQSARKAIAALRGEDPKATLTTVMNTCLPDPAYYSYI